MNKSEYLIFRHTISNDKYRVPIDYSRKQDRDTKPSDMVAYLRGNCYWADLFRKNLTCCISGGLDSSLLAAIAKPKVVYSCVFEDEKFDEGEWANMVAEHIKAELVPVVITKDRYLSTLEYLIRIKGDGLHPNEPCLYLLARQAKKDGFDTILSGEGADDIFRGYTDLLENEDKYMRTKESFLARYAYARPKKYGLKEDIPFGKFKKWGMEQFILRVHTPGLIERAVNAGKCAGVEFLFPYLMNDLPQIAWETKKELKHGKKILKEVAEDYLPKEVIYRKKVGFPVPLDKWLGGIDKFLELNIDICQ